MDVTQTYVAVLQVGVLSTVGTKVILCDATEVSTTSQTPAPRPLRARWIALPENRSVEIGRFTYQIASGTT